MTINADTLLDRLALKAQLNKWRFLAVGFAVVALLVAFREYSPRSAIEGDYIARITFDQIIGDDRELYALLDEVSEDPKAKAVIVWLDTPGGSAVGGEEIYLRLREMAAKKPVVSVMRSVAASAGYMIALGSDHIIAREGTITGSIGVLIETAEISKLAEKIGINPIIVKSRPLKGTPSLLEKTTPEATQSLQNMIDDFYVRFVDMVTERRKLPREKVVELADGRVYSGRSALEYKLIDQLGGEAEAVKWLIDQKHIKKELDIEDVEIKKPMHYLDELTQSITGYFFQSRSDSLDGIAAVWHPRLN